jgi:hypothetical protein
MVQIDALLFILLLEVAVVALLALAALAALALRRRARRERAVRSLVGVEGASGEEDGLAAWLERMGGLGGQAPREALEELRAQRRQVLQHALRAGVQGDMAALAALREDLDGLLARFTRLEPAPAAESPEECASTDELEELRGQNQQLTEELRITQQTMDKMLTEYASSYEQGDAQGGEAAQYAEDALELTVDPEEEGAAEEPEAAPAAPDPAEELLMLPEDFREEEAGSR